jgi:Mg-chelatase subunit ChlD
MALTQPWGALAALAALVVVAALALLTRGAVPPGAGAPIAGAERLRALPRFRALAARRSRTLLIQALGVSLAALGAVAVVARPVVPQPVSDERTNRDIVLCLDVSGSMTEVDQQIVDAYVDLARNLDGERIGFVLFDASAVTVFPLTDDAEFIQRYLTETRALLDGQVVPGTRIGEGSSLIGDGLTSCVGRFDVPESDRSRTVVLATDNQLAGRPIFTLDQAVGRAVDRDVLVYGIVPSDNTPSVTRDLTEALRRTGGDVLLLSPDTEVGAIEAAVRAQEAKAMAGIPRRQSADLTWPGAAAIVLGLALAGRWRAGSRWRRPVALVLAGVMVWQPKLAETDDGSAPPAALDVLLVVDRTTSMGAMDYDGDQPRMTGVAHDVEELVRRLGPARYSVITSDNVARVAAPWTTDASAIVSLAQTVGWREESYGTGSDIAAAADLTRDVLSAAADARPDTARFVVYLGDGEQTADDAPGSFAAAGELADGALVLGYGTAEGGRMRQSPNVEELVTRNGEPQLSHIDEDALKTIAEQLGGAYEHRAAPGPFASPLPAPRAAVVDEGGAAASLSLAWLAGCLALLPLGWELFGALRRWRDARREAAR